MECTTCGKNVLINDLVCCCQCKKCFHARCVALSGPAMKLINASDNLMFKCNNCLLVQSCDEQNVSVSDVNMIKDEIKKISASIIDIRSNIAAQIDSAVKIGMDEIKQNVNGTLKDRVANFEEIVNKNMENMSRAFFGNKREQGLTAINEEVSDSENR